MAEQPTGGGQFVVYLFLKRNSPRAYAPESIAFLTRLHPISAGIAKAAARLSAKGLIERVTVGDEAGEPIVRYYYDGAARCG